MSYAGLECRVGRGRVIVPAASVERLDELIVAPPLTSWPRRVSGVGVCGGQLVLALSLTPSERVASRAANGLLFQERAGGVRWALEITAPVGLIVVDELAPNPVDSEARPRWLWSAITPDREQRLWIDVEGMLTTLGGAATR